MWYILPAAPSARCSLTGGSADPDTWDHADTRTFLLVTSLQSTGQLP
jgi:hypothetical protein